MKCKSDNYRINWMTEARPGPWLVAVGPMGGRRRVVAAARSATGCLPPHQSFSSGCATRAHKHPALGCLLVPSRYTIRICLFHTPYFFIRLFVFVRCFSYVLFFHTYCFSIRRFVSYVLFLFLVRIVVVTMPRMDGSSHDSRAELG